MDGLTGALTTAGIALFVKLYIDFLERARERRTIAAAIAGELAAYLILLKPLELVAGLRRYEDIHPEQLKGRLAALPVLPTTHPVFDKLSDKLGRLPVREVTDISAAYNVVTGMRLHMTNWRSAEFWQADRDFQIVIFRTIADGIERQAAAASSLINRLEWIARQGSWSNFLVGSEPPSDLPVTRILTKLLSPANSP